MATKFLDNTGLTYFWGKIKSYVTNLLSLKADDSTVVHIAGTETITGVKTFTSNVVLKKSSPRFLCKDTRGVKGTAPSSDLWTQFFCIRDNNNVSYGGIEHNYKTNRENRINLIVYPGTTNTTSSNAQISVGYDTNGNWFTYSPTPAVADSSTKIATTAWARTATGNFACNAATASAVAWSGVTDKPSTFTPSSHNQASSTITAMTSYAKASASSAIAASDSLNTAIGKLEYKVDALNTNSVPPLEVVSLTANTSLTVTDSYTYQKVICLNTGGITVTLPTCSNSNARFFIKNNTNSKCYLALASGVTLDGSSGTIDLDPYGYINVIYGGSANTYIIIGGSI